MKVNAIDKLDSTSEPTLAQTLLEAPKQGHIVEFYNDISHLARQIADFAEPGLLGDDAVILIAVPSNLDLFRHQLQLRHLPVAALERMGRLKCLDAEEILNSFTTGNSAYWTQFEAIVGAEIDVLFRKHRKVRAYGEMVNLLWHKGFTEAALELEGFWNRLSHDYPFCLLCAYSIDMLDPDLYPKAISSICRAHSHVFANSNSSSFERVIQRAIHDILEPRAMHPLQAFLQQTDPVEGHLSASLKMLLWLSRNMPQVARQVLIRARYYYLSGAHPAE